MADEIRVNGNTYSYASTILKIDGERYWGITSMSYGDKRERVHGYGMGKSQAPRSKSKGKYTVKPTKLVGEKATIQAIRDQLAAKSSNGKSYGDVSVPIFLQYVEDDQPDPITIEILDCTVEDDDSSNENNSDPSKDEITFLPMRIKRNGLTLYDSSQEVD